MESPRIDISRAITPLRLIFWGGLLVLFDFRINGFDLANDFVGLILIVWAIASLSGIRDDQTYRQLMRFVRITAILSAIRGLILMGPGRRPEVVELLLSLVGLMSVIGTVLFCVAMRRLCLRANLHFAAQSWKTTMILFGVIYLVPLGLFYLAAAIAIVTNQTFNFNVNGGFAILVLIAFFVPIIHLFISTSRMKREAEAESQGGSLLADFER